ncbi:MAG: hypothetical protein LBN40_04380 [Oscillospiraceae bacterium]|jgi:hypothetical protein|nr:hypothetical protein [Oscillospiraceae bacterium]
MEIGRIPYVSSQTSATTPKTSNQQNQTKSSAMAADNADKFTPSEATYSPTYTNPNARKDEYKTGTKNNGTVKQIKNESLKTLVQETLSQQANKAAGGYAPSSYKPLYTQFEEVRKAYAEAEETSKKHEDYWSVDATAERIYTFARSLAGENDGLFDTMKDAFLKGFDQALGVKKGKLPEISYQTKAKVLEHFDSWAKEIADKKTAAVTTTAPTAATTTPTPATDATNTATT